MPFKRPATGLAFCLFYLSSYFTNKYVLSVLKFTYPTLFQGWQTLVGGILLHVSWKIGWVEISSSSRSEVLSWLPASALFVGIIYSGSRALSRLPIPIFLTLHNAADVIFYGVEASVQKEQNSALKLCRVLILLLAAGGLPFYDPQFDTDGYFWAIIHLLCVGAYKVFYKLWKPNSLSNSEQQYINYAFSVVMLAFASHPTGDLFSALEFPLLYFYIFHSSCLASGLLGFLLTLHTMKLKSSSSSGQYITWNFLAKPEPLNLPLGVFCSEIDNITDLKHFGFGRPRMDFRKQLFACLNPTTGKKVNFCLNCRMQDRGLQLMGHGPLPGCGLLATGLCYHSWSVTIHL